MLSSRDHRLAFAALAGIPLLVALAYGWRLAHLVSCGHHSSAALIAGLTEPWNQADLVDSQVFPQFLKFHKVGLSAARHPLARSPFPLHSYSPRPPARLAVRPWLKRSSAQSLATKTWRGLGGPSYAATMQATTFCSIGVVGWQAARERDDSG